MDPRREALDSVLHRAEYQNPAVWFFRRLVGAATAFLVIVTLWWLVTLPEGFVDDRMLPAPGQVSAAAVQLDADGFAGADLWGHVTISLLRLGFGLGFGLVLGGFIGLAMAVGPRARNVLDPVVSTLRMTPPVVVIPLFLIWFGFDQVAIVGVVAHGVVWPVADAVGTVRIRRIRRLGVDAVHEAASSARSVLLLAWTGVLVVEVVVASEGLGWLVWSARERSDMLLVGVLLAATIGVLLDIVVRVAQYVIGRSPRGSALIDLRTPGPVGPTTVDSAAGVRAVVAKPLGPILLGDRDAQRET